MGQHIYELTEEDHIDEFLDTFPMCALFLSCEGESGIEAFEAMEQVFQRRSDLCLGMIRAERYPHVADYVAEVAGVQKQLPQFLLLVDGECVWQTCQWNDASAIIQVLDNHLGPVPARFSGMSCGSGCGCVGHAEADYQSDMSPYITLLEQLVDGRLNEQNFSERWITTFEEDEMTRSAEEFEAIGQLLEDEDEDTITGVPSSMPSLRQRAAQLLANLTQEAGI